MNTQRLNAPLLEPTAQRALREGAFWLLAGIAVIVLVALLSYKPTDPGFSHTGDGNGIGNAIGPAGAWFADFLFLLFGRASFLVPVLVAYAGWLIYRRPDKYLPDWRGHGWLRAGGFAATLIASCGLATMHFAPGALPESAGGVLGEIVGDGLSGFISFLGATLFLLSLWIAGVSLLTGLSWMRVMDTTGRYTLRATTWFEAKFVELKARYTERQIERRIENARHEPQREPRAPTLPDRPSRKPRIEPLMKKLTQSKRAEAERQVPMFSRPAPNAVPPLSLLDDPPDEIHGYSDPALEAMSRQVELKLKDFGIDVDVVSVHPGPVVTRFEMRPAPGVKVSRISNLAKDLARSLSAISVRIVDIIPGKSVVGLELPNESRELVTLGEIVKSTAYDETRSPLALALGKDIAGHPVVADLSTMPHLLVAGTTGSGKSVAINAMILSLLYKATANEVRMIMIDPKMLELSVYEGIPHLLTPVVTDMKEAANALRWCVAEMERRYRLMSELGVRHLAGYNRKVRDAVDAGKPIPDPLFDMDAAEPGTEHPVLEPLPLIVVVVDELADMMMIVGKKVEQLIARLAQKARASGIHLLLATQRPSVDVITGLIKANIPARIAFQVSSRVDSRVILDQIGAEHLLGHGDMLYLPPGTSVPTRIHGAFVDDQEVHRVVGHLKDGGEPTYLDEILTGPTGPTPGMPDLAGEMDDEEDPLYGEAIRIVLETRKASISGVQRRLKVGYNRAARMVEAMEAAGIVGPLESNGSREILLPAPPKE